MCRNLGLLCLLSWSSSLLTTSQAQWDTNEFMKREHSLIKPYQGEPEQHTRQRKRPFMHYAFSSGGGFGIPNWDFFGSTMVTGSHIRLTADTQSQQGAIWNKVVSKRHLA